MAFTGFRLTSIDLPFGLVGFSMVTGGLYGLGFFLVPKVLIDMNFNASVDKYHEFLGRFSGMNMLVVVYALYAGWFMDPFKFVCLWMGMIAFVGPTAAALYVDPKQTPEGHMPAHILFLIAGLLAVNE